MRQFALDWVQAWVLADPFTERLRFEIDRKWRGELPRAYLSDTEHNAAAFSGRLDPQHIRFVRRAIWRRCAITHGKVVCAGVA